MSNDLILDALTDIERAVGAVRAALVAAEPEPEPVPEPSPPVVVKPTEPVPPPPPAPPIITPKPPGGSFTVTLPGLGDLNGATLAPGTYMLDTTVKTPIKWVVDGKYLGIITGPVTVALTKPGPHKVRIRTQDETQDVTVAFSVQGEAAVVAPVTPTAPVVTQPVKPAPMPNPTPPPIRKPSEPPSVSGSYARAGTAAELTAALANAPVGGLVVVTAKRILAGRFVIARRLTLLMEDDAGIDGGDVTNGYALHIKGAPGVVVAGGQVFGAQKGLVADGSSGCKTLGVHIHSTGMEAWHVRGLTNDAEISRCLIENTALDPAKDPGMGEGIYVGSAKNNWASWSGGKPDVCLNTAVLQNVVRGTRGECLDVKEATRTGWVEGNDFDGGAMNGAHYADSPVDVKGNGWTFTGNTFRNGYTDLVQTHSQATGYGHDNVFSANTYLGCPNWAVMVHPDTERTIVNGTNVVVGVGKGLVNDPAALR